MSVRRATLRAITSSEGRQPPGKMCVLMNDLEAFSTSYARSSIVIAWSSIAPSSASSSEHLAKNAPMCRQPTASIISIETSLS